MKHDQLAENKNRGFTIIEMIVVISIFAIMAGLVLFRYREYQANINLENTTQDIALQIQKAETDAISGRYPALANGQSVPVNWKPSFGVYFDSATPKEFKYFFDYQSYLSDTPVALGAFSPDGALPGVRGVMDGGGLTCGNTSTECTNVITITNDAQIQMICRGALATCAQNSYPNVSLVFTRPFPDRSAIGVAGGVSVLTNQDMRIRVGSEASTRVRDIVITPLGQIRIEKVQ